MARINAGYTIIASLPLDARHEFVIGMRPTPDCAPFVVWDCTDKDDYNNGGYCNEYRQALEIISDRIRTRYDYLPRSFSVGPTD